MIKTYNKDGCSYICLFNSLIIGCARQVDINIGKTILINVSLWQLGFSISFHKYEENGGKVYGES